jgi:hypothetical protein
MAHKGLYDKEQIEAKQKAKRLKLIAILVTTLSICDLVTVAVLNHFGIISERAKLVAIMIIAGLASPLGITLAIVSTRLQGKAGKSIEAESDDRGALPPKW